MSVLETATDGASEIPFESRTLRQPGKEPLHQAVSETMMSRIAI